LCIKCENGLPYYTARPSATITLASQPSIKATNRNVLRPSWRRRNDASNRCDNRKGTERQRWTVGGMAAGLAGWA